MPVHFLACLAAMACSNAAVAKRLAASALESPDTSLRIAGIVSAILGVVLIWLIRG